MSKAFILVQCSQIGEINEDWFGTDPRAFSLELPGQTSD